MAQPNSITRSTPIHLSIEPRCLESLLREGRLNIHDFNCLDYSSKRNVWSILRTLAAKWMFAS